MVKYQYGSTGDDVKKLQSQLNNAGYDIDEDGIYGSQTEGAVRQYQAANKLIEDGIAGPQTLGNLNKVSIPSDFTYAGKPPVSDNLILTGKDNAAPTLLNNSNTGSAVNSQANAFNLTGLTGLRDYGEGKGLKIDWSQETGPTVNGNKIDTSGLKYNNGRFYGDKGTLDNLFKPYLNQAPASNEFKSKYDDSITLLLDKFLNPKVNSFNPETNPEFQIYKDMYTRAGDSAFQNTIGDLAAVSGDGRISSYSASAAAQAKNKYMQDLNNIIPQLEEKAYGRNRNEYGDLANQLSMLQGMDAAEYGKYRDSKIDSQADRAFDYGVGRNEIADKRYADETAYQRGQVEIGNALANREISIQEAQERRSQLEFDFNMAQAKKTAEGEPTATAGQRAAYNNWMEMYLRHPTSITADFVNISTKTEKQMKEQMGEGLYKVFLDNLAISKEKQVLTTAEQEMFASDNPTEWLKKEYNDGYIKQDEYEYLNSIIAQVEAGKTGDPVVDSLIPQMFASTDFAKFLSGQTGLTQAQYETLIKIYNDYSKTKASTSLFSGE